MEKALGDAAGEANSHFFPATKWAAALFGDAIASNLFQVGFAYQKGLIPLSLESIMRAIEMNGIAVEMNKRTFNWGRVAALDIDKVREAAAPQMIDASRAIPQTLEEIIAHRVEHLTGYHDAAYANKYKQLVETVRNVEQERLGKDDLAKAVAKYYAKLLAVKDEYEVSRLYTDGRFEQMLDTQFEGDYTIKFNLAPEHFSKRDPVTGRLQKRQYGKYMLMAFGFLKKLKFLRFTPLDIFNMTHHRKLERQLAADYEKLVAYLVDKVNAENHEIAVELASLPEIIRGYDVVKEGFIKQAKQREALLLGQLNNPAKKPENLAVEVA
jgi:indolepyruvate ferredoxin oxidoreductase